MSTPLLSPEARARAVQSLKQRSNRTLRRPTQRGPQIPSRPWRDNPMNRLERYRNPHPKFNPGYAIRQNRFNEHGHKAIPTYQHKSEGVQRCIDPLAVVEQEHIKLLDPSNKRTTLFAKGNPRRVKPGDILLVRLKNGDPFSGVCLTIRQRHAKVDWAILLRNHLTRVATEMWFKIYSPNIEAIEIVQRAARRARRAKLFYMRKPKHDIGSVENTVRQYMRKKAGVSDAPVKAPKIKNKKKKKAKNA